VPFVDNTFGQTNGASGLNKVKLVAGGGDFTLAVQFSPLVLLETSFFHQVQLPNQARWGCPLWAALKIIQNS
jgi:hypothetical protein